MRTTSAEPDIWDRWAPLGGILFVVAFIVATIFYFAGGTPAHDTPSSVHSFLLAHRGTLEASWWLSMLAQGGVLIYIMGLSLVFRRWIGAWTVAILVLLAAGIISIALGLVEDGTVHTLLYVTLTKTSGDVSYALYTVGTGGISSVESVAVGVSLLAGGSLILTTGAIRRWLGWVGIVSGVLTILGSTVGDLVDVVGFAGLDGGILSFVFVAGTSVSMLGRRGAVAGSLAATANA
jgi:hypothetical protein